MAGNPAKPYVRYVDFVALEEKSETKHEWLDGVIYDMSGSTPIHARLTASVTGKLVAQLEGHRCTPYSADLQIRVSATGLATYPDVAVVCGDIVPDPENKNAATNPRLIVEVLSDSTEQYDRGEKFAHYKRISALMEYVLVSQHEPCIEVFRRRADGSWGPAEKYSAGETAALPSIECALSVDKVYASSLRDMQKA